MGCSQSRKEHTFTADELKKLRDLHQKTSNSYAETKGKDDLTVQAFRDLFAENQVFGERLHAFILKVSTTNRVDVEIFVDVLELLIRKSSNQRLNDMFTSQDKVGLICMILFPHLRKTLATQKNMNSLLSYSEAFDFTLCILRMFNAQPDQKVNEATARTITDRIFNSNDAKIEFWSFGMLIKEQINLIGSLIHIYLKGKFLDGTVSFLMPKMPDLDKQVLIRKDELTQLYLNNQYLLNASEVRLLYQADRGDYNFEKLVSEATGFTGQTFVLLQFQDSVGQTYTVGGFNPWQWKGNNQADSALECYIFSLAPKYKHFYPILDAMGTRAMFRQQFVLNSESGYGQEQGIAFGASKDDSRIWLDGKSLQNSTVKNTEKFFKKGALIPSTAQNPVCTLVEVYGVRTDLTKKNFSYSATNVGQLSSVLTNSKDIRSTLTGSSYDSQYTQFTFKSSARATVTENNLEEVVKRSKNRNTATAAAAVSSQNTTSYTSNQLTAVPQYQPVGSYVSPNVSSNSYVAPASTTVTTTNYGYDSTPYTSSPVITTNTNYLYQTAQPATTTTTYSSYQPQSNAFDNNSEAQRKVAVEALTRKYEATLSQNNGSADVGRSTLPAFSSQSYNYQVNGTDDILGRSSSIPTYQAYSYKTNDGQLQY